MSECRVCKGFGNIDLVSGGEIRTVCETCKGTGRVQISEKESVIADFLTVKNLNDELSRTRAELAKAIELTDSKTVECETLQRQWLKARVAVDQQQKELATWRGRAERYQETAQKLRKELEEKEATFERQAREYNGLMSAYQAQAARVVAAIDVLDPPEVETIEPEEEDGYCGECGGEIPGECEGNCEGQRGA